jgi:hypothetical protein
MYYMSYVYCISPTTLPAKAIQTGDLTDYSVISCNAATITSNSPFNKLDSDT